MRVFAIIISPQISRGSVEVRNRIHVKESDISLNIRVKNVRLKSAANLRKKNHDFMNLILITFRTHIFIVQVQQIEIIQCIRAQEPKLAVRAKIIFTTDSIN